MLRQYSKGLIATSACLGGEVCSAFHEARCEGRAAGRRDVCWRSSARSDFFIEVQKQGIKEQDMVNPELAELAKKLGVGLVATNDVHFLNKDDHYAHDVLCCISMGRLVTRRRPAEVSDRALSQEPAGDGRGLRAFRQAIENTVRIAQMCNLELDFSKRYAPVYQVPAEKLECTGSSRVLSTGRQPVQRCSDDERYLRQLCEEGLNWRYGTTRRLRGHPRRASTTS